MTNVHEHFQRVVWMGAGACWDCGLPLGDVAAGKIVATAFETTGMVPLLKRVEDEGLPWPRFEVVLDVLSRFLPHAPVQLLGSFQRVGRASTPALLAKVARSPWLWVTTNFDDQIETALEAAGRAYRVIRDRENMARLVTHGEHCVLKLHGDSAVVDTERDLGVKIGQILRAFPGQAEARLAELAKGIPLLVIGYAARDPDLFDLIVAMARQAVHTDWIDLGEPSERVRNVMAGRGTHHTDGAPRAVERLFGESAPEAVRSDEWPRRIHEWCDRQNKENLLQFVASMLVERGGKTSEAAVNELHTLMCEQDHQHKLWRLERSLQVMINATKQDAGKIDELRRVLTTLVNSESVETRARAALTLSKLEHGFGSETAAESILRGVDLVGVSAATQIEILLMLGAVQVYGIGEKLTDGIDTLKRAQTLAEEMNEPVSAAEATLRVAIGLMRWDRPNEAAELLEGSEVVAMEVGTERIRNVWAVNIAEAYRIARRFDDAIQRNQKIHERAVRYGDMETAAKVMGNIGLCHVSRGDVQKADNAFAESGATAVGRGGGEIRANAEFNRGWVRLLAERWEEAIPHFERAEELYRAGGHGRVGAAAALVGWARFRLGDVGAARRIHDQIVERREVPSGLMRWEFDMLEQGLAAGQKPDRKWFAETLKRFNDGPEQRCQLCLWTRAQVENQGLREMALNEARMAAHESKITLLSETVARQT